MEPDRKEMDRGGRDPPVWEPPILVLLVVAVLGRDPLDYPPDGTRSKGDGSWGS